jgi:hypothetical protein
MGDPAELGPPLVDAGATLFTIGEAGPTYNLDRVRSWVDWRNSLTG